MSQIVSDYMQETLKHGSAIRKMFEEGNAMKAKFGADKVCDFSIGNPDLAPPSCVQKTLQELAEKSRQPSSFGYMQNAGFDFARATLAQFLTKEQNITLDKNDVLLTCGAAGGMHVLLRSILNNGDVVLGISPFFVEYIKYVESNNGIFKAVPSHAESFMPDIDAIEKAIDEKTRAIIVNSPNNPTGVIYTKEVMQELAKVAERASQKYGHIIYIISDEPYRFLTYDIEVPSVLDISANFIAIGSFSKSLSLAGERIGYVALSPLFEERGTLMAGLIQANRFLGFVNAPTVGQYLMNDALSCPDLAEILEKTKEKYRKRRDKLAEVLTNAGIEYKLPQGAFYFFIKSPTQDEKIFIEELKKEHILAVPGSGYGVSGYARLSYAVPDEVIERSAAGYKKAVENLK